MVRNKLVRVLSLWCFQFAFFLIAGTNAYSQESPPNSPKPEQTAQDKNPEAAITGKPAEEEPSSPSPKQELKAYKIPWHWTKTEHVMVRVKINGKGPFNMIVDSGAPVVVLHSQAAQKIDPKFEKPGVWLDADKIEVEGGLVREKVKVRVEDMFQLEGMNGLGVAGVRLDGVLGYWFLAKYRIEFDFDSDEMTWTELDFEPRKPESTGGHKSLGLETLGQVAKGLGKLLGRGIPVGHPQGFIGIELADESGKIVVRNVLAESPGAEAGLLAADVILKVEEKSISSLTDLQNYFADLRVGKKVKLSIRRGEEEREVTVVLGEGV